MPADPIPLSRKERSTRASKKGVTHPITGLGHSCKCHARRQGQESAAHLGVGLGLVCAHEEADLGVVQAARQLQRARDPHKGLHTRQLVAVDGPLPAVALEAADLHADRGRAEVLALEVLHLLLQLRLHLRSDARMPHTSCR